MSVRRGLDFTILMYGKRKNPEASFASSRAHLQRRRKVPLQDQGTRSTILCPSTKFIVT